MTMHDTPSIPTRVSLLARLKDWENHDDWRAFFETYWRLIHATALKAGLGESEAQEVVQEVMIAAAKKLPEFRYEPGKDSLKGWLLGVTRWKVADQFRKRENPASSRPSGTLSLPMGEGQGDESRADDDPELASVILPRESSEPLDDFAALWDREWRENLLRTALERVKQQVNPAHYEIYHLHVLDGLPARDTARTLGVNIAQVYLAKMRVGHLIKQEVRRLAMES